MNEILTERSGSILKVQLNRPAKKNADHHRHVPWALAEALETAAKDDATRVVLIHGAATPSPPATISRMFVKNPPAPARARRCACSPR